MAVNEAVGEIGPAEACGVVSLPHLDQNATGARMGQSIAFIMFGGVELR